MDTESNIFTSGADCSCPKAFMLAIFQTPKDFVLTMFQAAVAGNNYREAVRITCVIPLLPTSRVTHFISLIHLEA